MGILAVVIAMPDSVAQSTDVAVVVNAENRVGNISAGDLRRIFAGEKRLWPGGFPVKIIVRAPGCRERLVLLKLLNMSEGEYKHYWTAQVFRGEADAAPFEAPSLGMAMEAVGVFPGAITLVAARDIKPGMNVVKVSGFFPGAAGYPLRAITP